MDCGGCGYEAAKSIRSRMGENEEKGADVGDEGRGTRMVERSREAPRDLSPDCLWPYSV